MRLRVQQFQTVSGGSDAGGVSALFHICQQVGTMRTHKHIIIILYGNTQMCQPAQHRIRDYITVQRLPQG